MQRGRWAAAVAGFLGALAAAPAAAALAGGGRVPLDQVVTEACTGEPVAIEGTADVVVTVGAGHTHALRTHIAGASATGKATGTRWRMGNPTTIVIHRDGPIRRVDQPFTLALAREDGDGGLVVDGTLHLVVEGRKVTATLGPAFAACDGESTAATPPATP